MKILVCSDGSERARRALASAATIANATKAQTTIFGIVEAEADKPRLLEALSAESGIFREQERSAGDRYQIRRPGGRNYSSYPGNGL